MSEKRQPTMEELYSQMETMKKELAETKERLAISEQKLAKNEKKTKKLIGVTIRSHKKSQNLSTQVSSAKAKPTIFERNKAKWNTFSKAAGEKVSKLGQKIAKGYDTAKFKTTNSIKYVANNKVVEEAVVASSIVKESIVKPTIKATRKLSKPAVKQMKKFHKANSLKTENSMIASGLDPKNNKASYAVHFVAAAGGTAMDKTRMKAFNLKEATINKIANSKVGRSLQKIGKVAEEQRAAIQQKRATAKENVLGTSASR